MDNETDNVANNMNNNLIANIKFLCNQNNINLKDLSIALNFSSSAIAKWDKNTPSIEKINKVADYFNVSIDYLIGNSNIPTTAEDTLSDPDIITIQRLRSNLSSKDKVKMMKLLELQFEEDFPKESN